jgi:hypothetical protein
MLGLGTPDPILHEWRTTILNEIRPCVLKSTYGVPQVIFCALYRRDPVTGRVR